MFNAEEIVVVANRARVDFEMSRLYAIRAIQFKEPKSMASSRIPNTSLKKGLSFLKMALPKKIESIKKNRIVAIPPTTEDLNSIEFA